MCTFRAEKYTFLTPQRVLHSHSGYAHAPPSNLIFYFLARKKPPHSGYAHAPPSNLIFYFLARSEKSSYSHSIVPGGFEVTSNTTRFTSETSFVIRFEIRANTSYGTRDQSAVIASSLDTGRNTIG